MRSAYRLLAVANRAQQPSGSGEASKLCLKKLWKLQVPPKVRSFWWRVINKFIPARKILHDRHMEQISFCETCGAQQESIYHAMFECTWAKLFWAELRLLTDVKIPEFHPSTWAMDMIDSKLISE